MNKLFPKLFFVCLFMVKQMAVNGQVLQKVEHAVNNYYENNFKEKLFVHTDKEQYLVEELLWLKLYVVSAANLKPVALSKVAYVELLDQKNAVVLQAKIAIEKGVGSGSMFLPSTLINGKYKLRAYTNWLKNFGPADFFEKQITIYNPAVAIAPSSIAKSTPTVQFFPEGGNLIEGISNSVGFKVVSPMGKGIDVRGFVLNQKNDTVARFKSLKFGIGKFTFTPMLNNAYRAVLISPTDGVMIKSLPVEAEGYAIALTDGGSGLTLNLSTNTNANKAYLFVHNGSATSVAEIGNIINGKSVFQIDKAKLMDGISHFTIFTENGQAVSERLYFKKSNHSLNIEAVADTQHDIRKKIDLSIMVKTYQSQPVKANLSISVRKLDSLQQMDESDIVSYFWLSSELKGNIESPNYYFKNDSEEVNQALDNLILTQGWRRFKWEEVMTEKEPQFKFLPEMNGHLIEGKITDKTGAPVKYGNLYLSVPGSRIQFYDGQSDTTGKFIFNAKDFYSKNEILVQTDRTDTTSLIKIQSPFSDQYTQSEIANFNTQPNLSRELQAHHVTVQVQNSFTTNQLKRFSQPAIDSTAFYGKPFKTYKFSDYTRFKTMEETLREYVTETFVSKKQESFNIRLLGKDVSLNDNPLVLLDGVPYFSIDKAMEIDPNKIERLEIIPENYHYGSSLFAGILSFYSFKSNLANIDINPNAVVLDYEGLQLQREFYSPTYDTPSQIESRIPDFRNVLYWNPSISVDSNRETKLSFYSSDIVGTYVGTINGLSANGLPGTSVFTFNVR